MSKNFAAELLGWRGILVGILLGGGASVASLAAGQLLAAVGFAIGGVALVLLGLFALKSNRSP